MPTIRPVRKSDAQQILTLWNQHLPHAPLTSEKLQQFFASPHLDLDSVFVIEHQRQIAGFLSTAIRNDGVAPNTDWILCVIQN